jgi:DNA-directed RNA polymerase I subunit RPA49
MFEGQILPLIYFTHAELKSKSDIKGNLTFLKPNNKRKDMNDSNDTNSTNGISFDRNTSDSGLRKKMMRLCLQDKDMIYQADEEEESPFLIAAHDKQTDKLSIVQTPYFIMKPSYLTESPKKKDDKSLALDKTISYSEKLNSLTDAFGSSKKRKVLQTKRNNRIDKETLDVAVSAVVEDSRNSQNLLINGASAQNSHIKTNDTDFSILPTANKEAKTPAEVYDLHQVLGFTPSEFERFTSELSTKFSSVSVDDVKKWQKFGIYPNFVCEKLISLANSHFAFQYKIVKYKLLAYISYLIACYRLKSAQLRTKASLSGNEVPDAMINRLFDLYTIVTEKNAHSKNVRSMPSRMKDKLRCHIFIVALHIDDFETNLQVFQKDLKMSMQRIVDFFQTLGCHVKSRMVAINNDKKKSVCKFATLSLPLNDISKFENNKKKNKQ